jgi:tight adherence protein B
MNNEQLIFVFIIIVPFLVVTLIYFLYRAYIEMNRKRVMIDILSDSSNYILDTKKTKKVELTDDVNFIRRKLKFAGFDSNSSEYIFYFVSLGFGLLAGGFLYMVMLSPIAFVISSLIFSLFPFLILEKIISDRKEDFNFGLKALIDKVTSMMKSGVGFEQAFKKSILTSRSKFTKEVLSIYIDEKDIIGEDKAFLKMFNLVESRELRIFYLVVSIGRQSGGKFSNTLETLRKTLHDQGTIKQEITASTKEIKVGTYLIIILTVTMYIMMDEVFEGALNLHFFGSDTGKLQMFFIVIWVAFGIFVNNMLTKIKE